MLPNFRISSEASAEHIPVELKGDTQPKFGCDLFDHATQQGNDPVCSARERHACGVDPSIFGFDRRAGRACRLLPGTDLASGGRVRRALGRKRGMEVLHADIFQRLGSMECQRQVAAAQRLLNVWLVGQQPVANTGLGDKKSRLLRIRLELLP